MAKEESKQLYFETITIDDENVTVELKREEVKEYVKLEKRHFPKGSFKMESFLLDKFILESDFNVVEYKLFTWLKMRVAYNNRIEGFYQKDAAEAIKSSQPNISTALKKFEKMGLIYKNGRDYYFNDRYIKFAGDGRRSRPPKL